MCILSWQTLMMGRASIGGGGGDKGKGVDSDIEFSNPVLRVTILQGTEQTETMDGSHKLQSHAQFKKQAISVSYVVNNNVCAFHKWNLKYYHSKVLCIRAA